MTFVPAVEVVATQAAVVELPDLSYPALLQRFPELGSAHAVCLTGSIEAGWGNVYSDVDLIAFSNHEVPLPLEETAELWPGSDPCGVDWMRWVGTYRDVYVDIKVVSTDAVKIALQPFLDGAEPELCTIGIAMEYLIYRVWIGRLLSGEAFFGAQRETIARSSYGRTLARYLKIDAESTLTDTGGQPASGDFRTARLSSMKAAGLIADSALVISGEPAAVRSGCSGASRPRPRAASPRTSTSPRSSKAVAQESRMPSALPALRVGRSLTWSALRIRSCPLSLSRDLV